MPNKIIPKVGDIFEAWACGDYNFSGPTNKYELLEIDNTSPHYKYKFKILNNNLYINRKDFIVGGIDCKDILWANYQNVKLISRKCKLCQQ